MAQVQITRMVKVVIVGPGAVGKTCSVNSFVYGEFTDKYVVTIASQFAFKDVIMDNCAIRLIIWDLAGQDRYGFIRSRYYGGTSAVILMIDLTRAWTVEKAKEYIDEELVPCLSNVKLYCMAVVGNKMDCGDAISVSDDELAELADYAQKRINVKNIFWMKSSSKLLEVNRKMYESLIQCMLKGMKSSSAS